MLKPIERFSGLIKAAPYTTQSPSPLSSSLKAWKIWHFTIVDARDGTSMLSPTARMNRLITARSEMWFTPSLGGLLRKKWQRAEEVSEYREAWMLVASGMLSTNVCSELRRHYSRGGSTAGGEGTDSFVWTFCLIPHTCFKISDCSAKRGNQHGMLKSHYHTCRKPPGAHKP